VVVVDKDNMLALAVGTLAGVHSVVAVDMLLEVGKHPEEHNPLVVVADNEAAVEGTDIEASEVGTDIEVAAADIAVVHVDMVLPVQVAVGGMVVGKLVAG